MRWRLPSRRKCSLVVLVAAVGHGGRRPARSGCMDHELEFKPVIGKAVLSAIEILPAR
jgi:hypothetical protein